MNKSQVQRFRPLAYCSHGRQHHLVLAFEGNKKLASNTITRAVRSHSQPADRAAVDRSYGGGIKRLRGERVGAPIVLRILPEQQRLLRAVVRQILLKISAQIPIRSRKCEETQDTFIVSALYLFRSIPSKVIRRSMVSISL